MNKISALIYGIIGILLFNATSFYFIGFVGDFVVPKTIDSGVVVPFVQALTIDIVLIALFGLQHSVMARLRFKQWWLKIIPEAIERSTYVLCSSLFLILLCWQWQPLPGIIWQVENLIGYWLLLGLFWFGWLFSFFASALIDPLELMGLRQTYNYLRDEPYTPVPFQVVSVYKYIRHPIMLGTIIGLWAIPLMSVGHLILALGFTIYIFIGIYFEEKDMIAVHGEIYKKYHRETSMIIPTKLRVS